MRILALCALLLPATGPGVAGDEDRERIASDQAQVFDRLSSLRKRMDRLAAKLDQEGRVHKADLLRKAIAEVDARNLETRRDEIMRLVGDARSLQAHARQMELLADLEAVLKVLQDERELSDLEKQLADLRETLASVRELRGAERSLRERTEQLAGNDARRLDQLARQIEALLEKQRSLSNDTRERAGSEAPTEATAAQRAQEAAERRGVEQAVAQLAEEQREVVARLQDEKKARVGEADRVVAQAAKAAERGDPEDLREAAQRVGEQRAEAGERSAALAEALRALEEELSRAADRAAGANEPPPAGGREPLEQAIESAQKALDAELKADRSAASSPVPLPEIAGKEQELAPRAEELAGTLARGADASRDDPSEPGSKSAARALEEAAGRLREAQSALEERNLPEGLASAREALDRIEQAREDLERESARAEQERRQLAARQDFVRSQIDAVGREAGELAAGERESPAAPRTQAVQRALKDAAESARESTRRLQQDDPAGAQAPQEQTEEALEAALEHARGAAARAQEQDARQDPAQAQAQMKKLADEQRQIEEKLRDLMQRMRDRQQKKGQEQGSSAQRSMNRARQQLDDGEADAAQQSEKEAEKNLEEMEKKLREEENRYESLRSEEVLFRMKERLEDLRRRASALHDGITQVDVDRAGAERLSRHLRPRVQQLSADAGAISRDNEELRAKLAEEDSPTFPWVLEKNGADLASLRELLASRDPDTGEFTQVLADDVVTRYARLLKSLDDELRRRAEALKRPQEDAPQQDGGGRPSLVPPVAELLLLKSLEQDVLEDVRTLRLDQRDRPEAELLDARMKLLERLGHRHADLTEMFDRLVNQNSEPDEGDGADADGSSERDGDPGEDR